MSILLKNLFLPQVNVEYSTDHGMTWLDLVSLCFEDKLCQPHSSIAASHYHSVHDNWRRIILPLHGLPVSKYVHKSFLFTLI